jgi:hypothetical protein
MSNANTASLSGGSDKGHGNADLAGVPRWSPSVFSTARGFSAGAVLGANGASASYVGHNFWQNANGSYPASRELDVPAKSIHNGLLVAGYA